MAVAMAAVVAVVVVVAAALVAVTVAPVAAAVSTGNDVNVVRASMPQNGMCYVTTNAQWQGRSQKNMDFFLQP